MAGKFCWIALVCFFFFLSGCASWREALREKFFGTGEKACVLMQEYPGKTAEELQGVLEGKARGQFLDAYLKKKNPPNAPLFIIDTPAAREAALKKIEFSEPKKFFNGPKFGEVCLKARAFLEEEALEPFRVRKIALPDFCYWNDYTQVKDLKSEAEGAAIAKALEKFFPRLKGYPPEEIRQRLHHPEFRERAVNLQAKKYCLSFQAHLVPFELETYAAEKQAQKGPPVASPFPPIQADPRAAKSFSFKLDLSRLAIGDPADEYGRGIVVLKGPEGRALGTYLQKGAEAALKIHPGSSDFRVSLAVYYHPAAAGDGEEGKALARFRYENLPLAPQVPFTEPPLPKLDDREHLRLEWKRLESGKLQARFALGENTTPFEELEMAANFNEVEITKKGESLRLTWNGRHRYMFYTKGTSLSELILPLARDDYLYAIEVQPLKDSP